MGVEGNSDHFVLVAGEGVEALARVGVPEFGSGVEAASEDLVAALMGGYPYGTLKARE